MDPGTEQVEGSWVLERPSVPSGAGQASPSGSSSQGSWVWLWGCRGWKQRCETVMCVWAGHSHLHGPHTGSRVRRGAHGTHNKWNNGRRGGLDQNWLT